jgi:hypothetical protein
VSTGTVLQVNENGGLWFCNPVYTHFVGFLVRRANCLQRSCYLHVTWQNRETRTPGVAKQRNTNTWSGNQIRSPALRSVENTKCDHCVRHSSL